MTACTYSSSCSKSAWHEGLCRDHAREAYAGVALGYHTVANRGVCLAPQCGAHVTTPRYYCPAHADRLPRGAGVCRHTRKSDSRADGCCEYHSRYRLWCGSDEATKTEFLTGAMTEYRALFAAAAKPFGPSDPEAAPRKRKAESGDDQPRKRKKAAPVRSSSDESDGPSDARSDAELLRDLYALAAELTGRGVMVAVSVALAPGAGGAAAQ